MLRLHLVRRWFSSQYAGPQRASASSLIGTVEYLEASFANSCIVTVLLTLRSVFSHGYARSVDVSVAEEAPTSREAREEISPASSGRYRCVWATFPWPRGSAMSKHSYPPKFCAFLSPRPNLCPLDRHQGS